MKIPKNHKKTEKRIYLGELEGPIEECILTLQEHAENITDCHVSFDGDYNGYYDVVLTGIEPMTDVEIARAREKALREKERKKEAAIKLEEQEREQLKDLLEKYGTVD